VCEGSGRSRINRLLNYSVDEEVFMLTAMTCVTTQYSLSARGAMRFVRDDQVPMYAGGFLANYPIITSNATPHLMYLKDP
jgi:hypothetical protein